MIRVSQVSHSPCESARCRITWRTGSNVNVEVIGKERKSNEKDEQMHALSLALYFCLAAKHPILGPKLGW